MKILFLHLSDIHIEKKEDGYAINTEKIVQALNSLGTIDECIIVISGDITQNGNVNEFKVAGDMLGNLINKLKTKKFKGKWISVITVPGNHDLDFSNNKRTFEDIINSFKNGNYNILIGNDIKALGNFYSFATFNRCFIDNKVISHKNVKLDQININFTLVNTGIFSLPGGSNQDMGIHYLNDEEIENIVPKSKGDLNVIVMHHSCEWFANGVKEKLRSILNDNFSLVFEGHEHDGFGENRKLNNRNSINYIQGNSLSGDKKHQKGFTTVLYDTDNKTAKGTSFIWNKDYYQGTEILNESLQDKGRIPFANTKEFIKYLKHDDNHRLISQFFVFPSLLYTDDELETKVIDNGDEFVETVLVNYKTVVSGDTRSGKSTLSKYLYQCFIEREEEIFPILLVSEDLRNKKIDRIVEYAFKNQYEENNNSYDKYLQFEREKRILLIDDAGKITKSTLNKILEHYSEMFNNIVLFSDQKIEMNIHKRVVDKLIEKNVGQINIRAFLYDKRKKLISKAYDVLHLPVGMSEKEQAIDELNNLITSQLKYFRLDPEFIVNFVMHYSEKFKIKFSPGENVFNMVYENSIKTKIINASAFTDVNAIFNIMEEMAFYMHFGKKSWISEEELAKIIEAYNRDFRQNVKIVTVIKVGEEASLIIDKESKIRFNDNNLLAYFVAQAINRKYHYPEDQEDIYIKTEYLLNNLCFGINSDIVLFMALITSNPKIIGLILNCAHKHFEHMDELSFDNNNIPFLCKSNFKVKNTIPDEKEKHEKEKQLVKYEEEELQVSEIVELVDLYNYDEKDIEKIENQVLKSIKFLEVLAKILPAFSHNMKATQQDELVKAIYIYPNRLIYDVLHEISDHHEEFVKEIFNEISSIRKERDISELNMEDVREMVERMSISLVVSLYQLVATCATTKQTINALDEFDFNSNSNYSIINLMMSEKAGNLSVFHDKAIKLYDKSELKLLKSMIKFTVRNYFLNHNVPLVGDGQSLIDKFFDSSNQKTLKGEMVKSKLISK